MSLCVVFLGSRRQQPVLLEEPVLVHQPPQDPEQADQVEALQDHGEGPRSTVTRPGRTPVLTPFCETALKFKLCFFIFLLSEILIFYCLN